MTTHAPIARRHPGNCQDCGHHRPVRTVSFWATGYRYRVCADCEKPYRHVINWPVRGRTGETVTPLRPGVRFLHARTLDPEWTPGPGQRYADAPPAECRVTAIRQGRVYYVLPGETRARRYFLADRSAEHVRAILTETHTCNPNLTD